jgi:hypothetical protein
VLVKNIEVPKIRDLKTIPIILKHPQKTLPTWLPTLMIANSHHCPPQFRHAETTVKIYRDGSPHLAKIRQWQPPQQTNTDTTH